MSRHCRVIWVYREVGSVVGKSIRVNKLFISRWSKDNWVVSYPYPTALTSNWLPTPTTQPAHPFPFTNLFYLAADLFSYYSFKFFFLPLHFGTRLLFSLAQSMKVKNEPMSVSNKPNSLPFVYPFIGSFSQKSPDFPQCVLR